MGPTKVSDHGVSHGRSHQQGAWWRISNGKEIVEK